MPRDYWFAFNSPPSSSSGLAPTFITFINSSGATIAPPSITEGLTLTGLYKASYNATQTIAFVLDGATTGLANSQRYIFGVFDPQDMFGSTLTGIGNTSIAIGTTLIGFGMTNVALGTTNVALGTTNVALGTTGLAVGVTSLSYTVTDNALLVNVISPAVAATGVTLTGVGNTLSTLGTYVGSTASSFGNSATQPATVFGYAKRVVEFLEGDQVYTKATGGLVFSSRGSSEILASKTVSDSTSTTTKT